MNIDQSHTENETEEVLVLRSILRYMPMLVYKIDLRGNIIFAEGAIASKFDKFTHIVGKNTADVFILPVADFSETISQNGPGLLSVVMINNRLAVLKHFVYRASISGVSLDGYHDDGFLCCAVDVTNEEGIGKFNTSSLLRMEKEIQELKALNRSKDKMFAVISHDLRAPVNSILALLKFIVDGDLPPTELLNNSKEMIDQLAPLSVLLDNLFRSATASFTENVQLKERELVNVYDIVQQNIGFLLYAAKRKKIQIANQVGKSARIWASADQIDVVFRNVIANAVKFTPVGGVILISAVVKKGNIEFVITDTGIGMSAEQLHNLFSANKKIAVGTDNERGTGLGLLITKEYVLENGGEIVVTSELNKGTTFRIIFPCPGRN